MFSLCVITKMGRAAGCRAAGWVFVARERSYLGRHAYPPTGANESVGERLLFLSIVLAPRDPSFPLVIFFWFNDDGVPFDDPEQLTDDI